MRSLEIVDARPPVGRETSRASKGVSHRIWLHDPRWLWVTHRVPYSPMVGLWDDVPEDWWSDVRDSAALDALLEIRNLDPEGRELEALQAAAEAEGLPDLSTPTRAALSLDVAWMLEHGRHRVAWLKAIQDVVGPGEDWASIGGKARQEHVDAGRVPAGWAIEGLDALMEEVEAAWPDDPVLRDRLAVLEVARVLQGGAPGDGEREVLDALEVVAGEGARGAIADLAMSRLLWTTSREVVEAVGAVSGADPHRRATGSLWAMESATRAMDGEAMAHWAGELELALAEVCVDPGHEEACRMRRTAVDSVRGRLVSDGDVPARSWQEAMTGAAWRCAMDQGGVRTLREGRSKVQVVWDGASWAWGPWPDDPGLAACLVVAELAPVPGAPLSVELTVEVGR